MLSETIQQWHDSLDEVIQECRVEPSKLLQGFGEVTVLGEDIF